MKDVIKLIDKFVKEEKTKRQELLASQQELNKRIAEYCTPFFEMLFLLILPVI